MAQDNKKQDNKDSGKKNPNPGGGSQDRHPDLPQRRHRQLLHDFATRDRRVQKAHRT